MLLHLSELSFSSCKMGMIALNLGHSQQIKYRYSIYQNLHKYQHSYIQELTVYQVSLCVRRFTCITRG